MLCLKDVMYIVKLEEDRNIKQLEKNMKMVCNAWHCQGFGLIVMHVGIEAFGQLVQGGNTNFSRKTYTVLLTCISRLFDMPYCVTMDQYESSSCFIKWTFGFTVIMMGMLWYLDEINTVLCTNIIFTF